MCGEGARCAERLRRVLSGAGYDAVAAVAWAGHSHAETLTGSIEPGKLADLVVLSQDIMRVPPREILSTSVRQTIVAGETVYERR